MSKKQFKKKKTKRMETKSAFALVVDGQTEKWYFELLRENLLGDIKFEVKPQIAKNKSLAEQYELVNKLVSEEHTKVFWVVDLDVILQETKNSKKDKESTIYKFNNYLNKLLKNDKIIVIVNNPCLEYWFLLHYENNNQQFEKCSKAENRLKNYINDYDKSKKRYKKENQDIFTKLKPNLHTAISNAEQLGEFDIQNYEKPVCEMYKFFNLEDIKQHFTKKIVANPL